MFHPWPTKPKKSMSVSVPMTYSDRMSRGAASAAAPRAPAATRLRVLPGAKEAGGTDEQHEDEEREDADLRQRAVQKEASERLHHAHEQAAEERAGERAEPAEHHHDEGGDHEGVADLRRDVEEGHRHGARGGHARAAEAEGDRVHARYGDADE